MQLPVRFHRPPVVACLTRSMPDGASGYKKPHSAVLLLDAQGSGLSVSRALLTPAPLCSKEQYSSLILGPDSHTASASCRAPHRLPGKWNAPQAGRGADHRPCADGGGGLRPVPHQPGGPWLVSGTVLAGLEDLGLWPAHYQISQVDFKLCAISAEKARPWCPYNVCCSWSAEKAWP